MAGKDGRFSLGCADVHVWLARTDVPVQAGLMPHYLALLNESERQRLGRFAFDYLKHEFLLTRALCRVALSCYANRHPVSWAFVRNAYGRPSLATHDPDAHLSFNLSNTHGLVACAITLNRLIGIDVEERLRGRELCKIAARFFSPSEVGALRATDPKDRNDQFIELWTLKEAYIKARGLGMTVPLDSFSFTRNTTEPSIAFHDASHDDPALWRFRAWQVDDNYRAAVAVRARRPDEQLEVHIREIVPMPYHGNWALIHTSSC